MKIDYELKIYKKYFDAILQLKKQFDKVKHFSISRLTKLAGNS